MINIGQLTSEVEEIKSERSGANYIQHVWLEGFRELTENIKLSKITTDKYLNERLNKFPKFTILVSSNYYLKYLNEMKSGKITINQLPLNEGYHLQFPLLSEGNFYKFMLTPCTLCEGDQEHNLPLIELRKSTTLPEDILRGKAVMCDNRISPRHIGEEIINLAYKSLNDLIVNNK